jgi:hypothetical protein
MGKTRVGIERNGTKRGERNGTAATANTLKSKHVICFCCSGMKLAGAFV